MKMWFVFEVYGLLGLVEYYAVFEQSETLARKTLDEQLSYNYKKMVLIKTISISQAIGCLKLNEEDAD